MAISDSPNLLLKQGFLRLVTRSISLAISLLHSISDFYLNLLIFSLGCVNVGHILTRLKKVETFHGKTISRPLILLVVVGTLKKGFLQLASLPKSESSAFASMLLSPRMTSLYASLSLSDSRYRALLSYDFFPYSSRKFYMVL